MRRGGQQSHSVNHWPITQQTNSIGIMKSLFRILIPPCVLLASAGLLLAQQQPTPQERVVALKASLAASQAILRQYEWVETTVASASGEEKSRKQERCYYGADGALQKVLLNQTTAPPKKRRLFGKLIAAKKQEELMDYMKEAIGLVKTYVPPDQGRIQAAKDAGRLSVSPQAWQQAKLTFSDYMKVGDSFALDVDLNSHRPVHAKVTTYVDSPKEPVTLDVSFGQLDNGATYASVIVLEAKSRKVSINVQNSGYRRMN
jgi:hypothetical protein